MKERNANVTISLCKSTYGTYITGQQMVTSTWKNGKNAGLWELLPVGTTVEDAREYVQNWAKENGISIIKETVY